METNYKYFLLYKRVARRFKLETIERHWDRLQSTLSGDLVKVGGR